MSNRRSKYKKRVWVYRCDRCGKWHSAGSLAQQQAARKLGSCPSCLTLPEWRLEVYKRLLQVHLDIIVAKGLAAPEGDRAFWRVLYKKRIRQAALVQQQLEPVEVTA
jgi:DNA-directed RNA polymerase subunit RPC12/RpoP